MNSEQTPTSDQALSKELLDFIQASPSMYHAVDTIQSTFKEAGFREVKEGEDWDLQAGKGYYVNRNGSSVLAFRLPETLDSLHFQITASHTDSPTFKLKSRPILDGPDGYLRLNVEGYGGMIDSTWFDRPLTLAGRCLVETETGVESRLLYIDKDLLVIPNAPIHFNRQVNKGYEFNHQRDLIPVFSAGLCTAEDFYAMLGQSLGISSDKILATDLFLVNRTPPALLGWKEEMVGSPKLDNLQCAFASMKALIGAKKSEAINVYASFDNEEVGSLTKQGAMSTFLKDCLRRIILGLGLGQEDYQKALSKSFLVSCDNAHALHPNRADLYDPVNRVYMNKGVVIKENAAQSYTTDAFSQAVFRKICQRAGVPVQNFANRSDLGGGGTLGNISNVQVSLHSVDIGLAQLAMHSAYETGGVKDTAYMIRALEEFYSTVINIQGAQSASFDR